MTSHEAGPLDPGGPVLLVGAGKMGGALLDGWLARGLDPKTAFVIDPALPDVAVEKLERLGCTVGPQAGQLSNPVAILVAVKPQMAKAALPAAAAFAGPGTVIISIMAGTTLSTLGRGLAERQAIVRAMPNTPAAVGRGVTGCVAGAHVTADQRALTDRLLTAVGDVVWVEEEALIDAVTGVSGSGPAYVFLMVEALARAGVSAGLPADLAQTLARKTVEGSGVLLSQSAEPPEVLRKNVTSPNGTTAAALDVLMADDGLAPLMERAVAAATRRAKELAG
ncbi:pyrroline-5-carboxylate reductase [Hansschlegelia plantiphila]|uniref:Pyrroline-5-carboxylate reductase n=1 Tax=Hansschlegelia plantiphila TaxID=374655 RepID=A0A9W6MVC9_9HYPH|nr:pyrroline-5-carboxylate reductase [Hansschlegelia plantiphila]GLK67797.1 pyrroline-5-carboxylate reductase [Hansschlegelia plantiphila]